MNTDELLFKELEKYSSLVRKSAKELALFLEAVPNKPVELFKLIMALEKINTTEIYFMDEAINDVNLALGALKEKNKAKFLSKPEDVRKYFEKQLDYIEAIDRMSKKAIEINKSVDESD